MGTSTTGDVAYYKPATNETGYSSSIATSQDSLDAVATNCYRRIYKRVTWSANDATPDVSGGGSFKSANTVYTPITTFDNGVEGQVITVEINDLFTRFQPGSTLRLLYNNNPLFSPPGVYRFLCINDSGLKWTQLPDATERTHSAEYIQLLRSNGITEWPAPGSTVWTTINLYNYSVPAGAARAAVLLIRFSTANRPVIQARLTGTTPTENSKIYYFATRQNNHYEQIVVPVTSLSQVDLRWVFNVGGVATNGWVAGYFRR